MDQSLNYAKVVPVARKKRSWRWLANLLAGGLGAVTAAVVSNDWCFVIPLSSLLALIAFWLIDAIVHLMWRDGRAPSLRLRLIVALVAGIAAGCALRVRPDWAFERAFGVPIPPGVHDLRMQRHYEGGPGDECLILQFTADRETIDGLVNAHVRDFDTDRVRRWRENGATWASVWYSLGGALGPFVSQTWQSIQPLGAPEAWTWRADRDLDKTFVLWDPRSGRAVAVHIRG